MNGSGHGLLVALDDSEASVKAVRYVGYMMGGRAGVVIVLWHMLPPLPPELLEFGGTSNPVEEPTREAELHGAQANWVGERRRKAGSLFEHARQRLVRDGVPGESIRTRDCTCVHSQETVPGIIDAAKASHCDTIVVGRHAFHGWQKLFGPHVSDQLISRCRDLTIWVVE